MIRVMKMIVIICMANVLAFIDSSSHLSIVPCDVVWCAWVANRDVRLIGCCHSGHGGMW